MTRFNVVTIGETMLRLTPPALRRLEHSPTLEIEVGGTESNVMIGLARLGLRTLWLSRLTSNPIGHLIAQALAAQNVDVSQVVWTAEDRVGLLFYEPGKSPRGSQVIYDRRGSAISHMRPEELPQELFQPGGAQLLHTSGISLALGPSLTETVHQARQRAKTAGWQLSFDFNYRHFLWEPQAAREGCEVYAQAADLLFIPRGDACTLFELDPKMPAERILDIVATHYPQATIALTLGAEGALGHEPGGDIVHQPAFPAEEVERLGGGDAFAAGFLYIYLTAPQAPSRLSLALRWGAAMAALKYGIPGDAPLIHRHEVETLLQQDSPTSMIRR